MPAVRTSRFFGTRSDVSESEASNPTLKSSGSFFPSPHSPARLQYRLANGKPVSTHAWAVYDYVSTIPQGKVMSYKAVAEAIGQGSPRTVGNALRRNPFAPTVPCHRVISSNLSLGGFFGERRSPKSASAPSANPQCDRKIALLASEGVEFGENDVLKDKRCLWDDKQSRSIQT